MAVSAQSGPAGGPAMAGRGRRGRLALALGGLLGLVALVACSPKPVDRLAQARQLLDKQDRAGAIVALKAVIQDEPTLAQARLLLGGQLLDNGDVAAAEIELNRALALGESQVNVLPLLARATLQRGQPQRVLNEYAAVALREPAAHADLRAVVAQAQATLGDLPAARASLAEALQAVPGHPQAWLLSARVAAAAGDLAGALTLVDSLLASQPGNADGWMLKGDLLTRRQAPAADILQAYQQALKLRPNDPMAHGALITAHLGRRDVAAAQSQLKALQQVLPKHPQTLLFEGQLAFVEGKLAVARDRFQTLLRGTPDNLMLLQSAAAVELAMQAPAQAETLLNKALLIAPDSSASRRLLARTLLAMGQTERAQAALEPLLGKTSTDADAFLLAAQARMLGGDVAAASVLFERARKITPDDARMRTAVALTQLVRGQTDSAIAELQAVAASDSGPGADLALISAELRRKSPDGALRAVDALERKQPGKPLAPHLRGQVLLIKQDNPAARTAFEQAVSRDPTYLPAVMALAGLDLQAHQPAQAQARFAALIKAAPGNSRAHLMAAELAARGGASREAVAALLGDAIKANPSDLAPRLALIDHHLITRDAKAAQTAAQAALTQMHDQPELLIRLGRVQMALGEYQQASNTYSRFIALQGKSAPGHLGLAEAQLAGGDLAAAARSTQRALELAPESLPARRLAISVALRQRQPAQAKAIAQGLQKLQPGDASGLVQEAEIEILQKQWDAALVPLRKALALADPEQAPERMHQVLVQSGRVPQAQAFASQWQQDHPADALFQFYLGDQALQRKDYATAEAHYQAVLKIKPGHALSLNNIAWIRLTLKQPGALPFAERAVAAAPNMPALMDTLAMAYAGEQQPQKAIDLQLRTLAMQPEDPFMRLNLARFYAQAGEKRKAKAELDRLAALGDRFARQADVAALGKSLGGR